MTMRRDREETIALRRAEMKSYFALGYRVLVKDSIVIMSEEEAWRKKLPRRKFIRSLKIDCHRVAIKRSMCSHKVAVCVLMIVL